MQWGEMTMGFKAPASGLPKEIKVGDRVTFEFRPATDGRFELQTIAPLATPAKQGKQP